MSIEEMTMEDMVAMFAMLGLLAQGKGGSRVVEDAYRYAEIFISEKKEREDTADE